MTILKLFYDERVIGFGEQRERTRKVSFGQGKAGQGGAGHGRGGKDTGYVIL